MKNKHHLFSYKITSNSDFMDKENAISSDLKNQMESLYTLALSGEKSGIKRFHKLIEQHPKNPQLKNYLSVLYHTQGNKEKANEVTKWIVAEHPDYLFGKLNIAFELYYTKQYDKIPEILGNEMELGALYPKRNTFHIVEVTGFLKATTLYFLGMGNLAEAENRLKIIKELAPDSIDAEETEKHVSILRMQHAFKNMKEIDKKRIKVETKTVVKRKKASKSPVFKHSEIQLLYKRDVKSIIDDLDSILNLPRITLIKDLELVLTDSIDRFSVHNKRIKENDFNFENTSFVIHAVYLLGELEATESLDVILEVLQQSDEFIHLFIGDFITEGFWEPLYKIVQNKLDVCKSFMYLPGVYTYSKSELSEAVLQIAFNQPKKKDEVISWFADIFDFYLKASIDDNIVDSTLIGLLISSVIEMNAVELLPTIKNLYKQHKVDVSVCGQYTSVLIDIKRESKLNFQNEVLSITNRYKNIVSTWSGYTDRNIQDISSDKEIGGLIPIKRDIKIGRNEPCPCGSGKKYKKCCLNKN